MNSNFEESKPSSVSYDQYCTDINSKNSVIEELNNRVNNLKNELEDAKSIINNLKGELKRYERIIEENNIAI